jgi:hypothetical protein
MRYVKILPEKIEYLLIWEDGEVEIVKDGVKRIIASQVDRFYRISREYGVESIITSQKVDEVQSIEEIADYLELEIGDSESLFDDFYDDYYDLIELPLGLGHIPVPIAKELVGEEEVRKIPLSEKIRDETFFSCPECGEESFFSGLCSSCNSDEEWEIFEEERKKKQILKESVFKGMIRLKRYKGLSYIKSFL